MTSPETIRVSVRGGIQDEVIGSLGNRIWDAVDDDVRDSVWAALTVRGTTEGANPVETVKDAVEGAIRDAIGRA